MKKTLSGLALAIAAVIAVSACTVRETRVVQPAVAPSAGTTVVVPEKDPDVVVDVD